MRWRHTAAISLVPAPAPAIASALHTGKVFSEGKYKIKISPILVKYVHNFFLSSFLYIQLSEVSRRKTPTVIILPSVSSAFPVQTKLVCLREVCSGFVIFYPHLCIKCFDYSGSEYKGLQSLPDQYKERGPKKALVKTEMFLFVLLCVWLNHLPIPGLLSGHSFVKEEIFIESGECSSTNNQWKVDLWIEWKMCREFSSWPIWWGRAVRTGPVSRRPSCYAGYRLASWSNIRHWLNLPRNTSKGIALNKPANEA